MSTELKRFNDAYATMTVATYEPLILHWISFSGIRFISSTLAQRFSELKLANAPQHVPTVFALGNSVRQALPRDIKFEGAKLPAPHAVDIDGDIIPSELVKKLDIKGFPQAMAVGNNVFLNGFSLLARNTEKGEKRAPFIQDVKTIPITIAGHLGTKPKNFDFRGIQASLQENLVKATKVWLSDPSKDLAEILTAEAKVKNHILPHMWPVNFGLQEALSPIGIAHYYKQYYFNKEEGVGPIEEAFTVAPLETLEVIYQTVRKQIHEEVLEQGLEIVSENAVEEKNLDEVSDKVSSMIQLDMSASMSANASGSVGVWQAGASASTNFSTSSQRSRELSTHKLKEVTKKASERITKSFTVKTKDTTEVTETSTTRRVIKNEGEEPVSYGLRRVLRKVNVKVQDLGPRLVWQLYIKDPGRGLARSRFVHFREASPISIPDIPPGVPPRPAGGTDSGTVSTALKWNADAGLYFVTIVIKPGVDRVVTGVRIDSITDLEGGGKDDLSPAPLNEYDFGSSWDSATNTYTANIGVLEGDSASVQVNYTFTFDPSQSVLDTWETLRATAAAAILEEEMTKQFERNKQLITEKSKIKSRPANDLRKEERYELMNRMVSHLFGRNDDSNEPTPLEIEYFHRYFSIDGIFVYTHPSWWKPRYSRRQRTAYEVTAESEPAPLGSSLGWDIQLDGDNRRNEFLNSPWVRVCIPIQPGREREAIKWLAKHIEGEIGYDVNRGLLSKLLTDIEAYRASEAALNYNGPDYVTVDSTPGAPADPAEPDGVYPLIDEFDITMPTDGFVYDSLNVVIP